MDSPILASGDSKIAQNNSPRAIEHDKLNVNEASEVTGIETIKDTQDGLTSQGTEDNEAKIKERIAQCRSIIESLKLELNEEKSKLERDSKMCNHKAEQDAAPSLIQDGASRCVMEDFENTSTLTACVDGKFNYDENLLEYEKQLQKYQNTLNMAQMEKKNAIRKHMLAKAYKLKLLEVENQCNIELLRVKQSLQCLEPLQTIANKWKTSTDEASYDHNDFVLIPHYPELNANSGSDLNSVKDDTDGANMDKPETVVERCC